MLIENHGTFIQACTVLYGWKRTTC